MRTKLRILIISTFFPPLNSIASLRPYSWAKTWSRDGHDVTVLTSAKELNSGNFLCHSLEGFEIINVPSPKWLGRLKFQYQSRKQGSVSQKNSWKKYFLNFFEYLRHKRGLFNACRMPDFSDFWIYPALRAVEKYKPWDVVISTAGPYSTHIIAANLKKRGLAQVWVADYRDAWSDSRIYPGLFPFNCLEGWLEKKIIKKADFITTISEPFAEKYTLKFPQCAVKVIENGFDPEDLLSLPSENIFPNDEKFRIVYTGSIYPGKQDPAPLFKALNILLNDKTTAHLLNGLELLFIGPNQEYLQKLVAKYRIEPWVKFLGFLSREKALQMQRDAHALLFLAWNDPDVDGIMTGKLFEYLYSSTPILSISNYGIEASQKLIVEANAGVVYTNPLEIAKWLRQHLVSPVKQLSNVDPELLKRFDRSALAAKLLEYVVSKVSK